MPYTLGQLPGEPIVVATITDRLTDETLVEIFALSFDLMREIDSPVCLICDFQKMSVLDTDDFEAMVQALSEQITNTHIERIVFYTFLDKGNVVVEELSQRLKENGFSVPVFSKLSEALTYFNLKIDFINIKKSMDAVDTLSRGEDTAQVQTIDPELTARMIPAEEQGTSVFRDGTLLRIEAIEMNRTTLLMPADEIIVGRRDSSNYKPDVDLSLWAGYRAGVSRRHARLVRGTDQHLYLYDLGSSNGTFLGNERLVANQPYLLRNGDEVRFGHLLTRISFVHSVVDG